MHGVVENYAMYHILSAIYRLVIGDNYRRLYTSKIDIREHKSAIYAENDSFKEM